MGVSLGVLLEEEGRSHRRTLQPYRGCLSQDDSLLDSCYRLRSQDDSFVGTHSGLLPPFQPMPPHPLEHDPADLLAKGVEGADGGGYQEAGPLFATQPPTA